MRDTRTLGTECHDLIETLYGQALAAGDDLLSERCSAAMEALREIGRAGEPLRIEAGQSYVSRDGRRVRVLCTDWRHYGSHATVLALVAFSDASDCRDEVVEAYRPDGRFGTATNHPLDIVGYWRDGLGAPAPALPEPYPQAAE